MKQGVFLLDIKKLRQHEAVSEQHLLCLMERIKRDGFLKNPVVADSLSLVVLDGHHRLRALKLIGAVRIPVYLVDYFSDNVRLFSRRKEYLGITKTDVIVMGLSRRTFPYKTTRHYIKGRARNLKADLKQLM